MAGPSDARRIQPFRYLGEKISRSGGKKCVNVRRAVGGGTVPRVLAVQDAQRIARKPIETVLGQFRPVRLKMFNQRGAPCLTRFRFTQCIKTEESRVGKECDRYL